ncbi:MAG TPA: hypothetical protein VGT40_23745 [Methylomirabilota bacterium]|nr:hypothetical protein [Methylomirabilota bacterium]
MRISFIDEPDAIEKSGPSSCADVTMMGSVAVTVAPVWSIVIVKVSPGRM